MTDTPTIPPMIWIDLTQQRMGYTSAPDTIEPGDVAFVPFDRLAAMEEQMVRVAQHAAEEIARLTRAVAAAEAAALDRAAKAIPVPAPAGPWKQDYEIGYDAACKDIASTIRALPRDGSALAAVVAEAEARGRAQAQAEGSYYKESDIDALMADRAALAKAKAALERIAVEDEGDADLNEWGSASVARDTLERLERDALAKLDGGGNG